MEDHNSSQVMHHRLMEAAETGDIDVLYSLLKQDPFVLEYFDWIPFVNTPLHIAVESEQTKFAMEIVRLKPSFVRKLNQDGFSPIHLGSINGNIKMVRKLADIDHDLCLLKGREGRTPLHCAVIAGKVGAINELLSTCPEAIEELTVGDETILHLAVKSNQQLESFRVLLRWMEQEKKMELLNWKDEDGNTVLHMATSTNQSQVVKMLVSDNNIAKHLEIHAMNVNGLTALDMFRQLPRELENRDIGQMLHRVYAEKHQHKHQHYLESCMTFIVLQIPTKIPNGIRNALLVVAVLITTTTYQAGISPPGGVWQDTCLPTSLNGTSTDIAPNLSQTQTHYSGQAVMGLESFLTFMNFNSIGFYTSLIMISILTLGLPMYPLVLLLLFSLISSYIGSNAIIAPKGGATLTPKGGNINPYIHVFVDILLIFSIIFLLFTLKINKHIKKLN